jgi:hypothetical protein
MPSIKPESVVRNIRSNATDHAFSANLDKVTVQLLALAASDQGHAGFEPEVGRRGNVCGCRQWHRSARALACPAPQSQKKLEYLEYCTSWPAWHILTHKEQHPFSHFKSQVWQLYQCCFLNSSPVFEYVQRRPSFSASVLEKA